MIFFRPTNKWVKYLAGYANGRIIVDIGCGEGYLLKQLYKCGYERLMGVDLYIDDVLRFDLPDVHLLQMNVLENNILRGLSAKCLFLFCRPCHGWWVQITLDNSLPSDAEVLYVGLPGCR